MDESSDNSRVRGFYDSQIERLTEKIGRIKGAKIVTNDVSDQKLFVVYSDLLQEIKLLHTAQAITSELMTEVTRNIILQGKLNQELKDALTEMKIPQLKRTVNELEKEVPKIEEIIKKRQKIYDALDNLIKEKQAEYDEFGKFR